MKKKRPSLYHLRHSILMFKQLECRKYEHKEKNFSRNYTKLSHAFDSPFLVYEKRVCQNDAPSYYISQSPYFHKLGL